MWPLRGVRVVELTEGIAGALATKMLADAGATVTRVELGSAVELPGPFAAEWHLFLDADKDLLALGRDPEGLARLDELMAGADLFVTTGLHERAEGLGLDCPSMLARHPQLVAVCVTPFGQDGPYAPLAADDAVLSALCGLADATPGFPDHRELADEPPVQSLAPLAEAGGAFIAALATFGALLARLRGLAGPRHIEVSTVEAAAALMSYEWSAFAYGGPVRGRRPGLPDLAPNAYLDTADGTAANAALGALLARKAGGARHVEVSSLEAAVSMMTYEWAVTSYGGEVRGRRPGPADLEPNCYLPCRDGMVVLVAFGDAQWRALVELMGNPGWASDPRFETGESRTAHWRELRTHLAEWTRDQEGAAVLDAAQARGVPCACAFELRETLASEHIRETEALRHLPTGPVPADPAVVNGVRRQPHRGVTRTATPNWPAKATPTGPLTGVRVLDLTQYVAGPFAGQCLAALGAEVVLIETSTHSPSRSFGPFAGTPRHDAGATFNHHNRGKRSVLLNLKTDEGRRILRELVRASDVVLENFSRRAAEKLGVTYDALAKERPDIILGSISGLGRSGPWGGFVALHSGVILLSGLADVTRDEEGRPRLVGSTYPDPVTGAYLALLVQQALAERAQTGIGCRIEVSMLDVALTCMGGLVAPAARGETFDQHPVRFLSTRERGRYVAVTGDTELDCTGLSRREAMMALQRGGVAAGAVLDMGEVIDDAHLRARGFVVADSHPVATGHPLPGVPWLYDGVRPGLGPAPCLGEGTRDVLAELTRLEDDELALLEQNGVLV